MIRVENLSYGIPAKELYENISFTLEQGQHCALIGSNGSGKSTLVKMLINPDEYLFDGRIIKDEDCRIGYAGQFSAREKYRECNVFEFLSERFVEVQNDIAEVCEQMANLETASLETTGTGNSETTGTENIDDLLLRYQELLNLSEAIGADNYESNVRKSLADAKMSELENTELSKVSGGEYKLLQIMKEMLLSPNLLILDEPDVFLDFRNIGNLSLLINSYKGTMLVITHNRFLLNHCFDKIIHLENAGVQEFEGTYMQYRCMQLVKKLEQKIRSKSEDEEISRTEKMVEILRKRATLMVNPTIGRSVNAKQTQLDRLLASHIKEPFIELREPKIVFSEIKPKKTSSAADEKVIFSETEPKELSPESESKATSLATENNDAESNVLEISGYSISFDNELLSDVSFSIKKGEKVAVVGPNGTGKTTLLRDIIKNENPAIHLDANAKCTFLSQMQDAKEMSEKTVGEILADAGFETYDEMIDCLLSYCLDDVSTKSLFGELSVGEQNLLQIAVIAASDADFIIMDEPTSHLDIFAKSAFEKAVSDYKGTVLMVSHDFYLISECADYVLLVENNTLRRISARKFRKLVYDRYFDSSYLETDKRRQETEAALAAALKSDNIELVKKLCAKLENLSEI